MAPLGAILLFLLAAGCDRFMPFSKRYGNPAYYEIVIETPRWRGLYPRTEPIPIRVTIHNGSPKPYVLDFAHDPRRGGCGEHLPVPPWRQPVEVYFTGKTAEGPYLWVCPSIPALPARLVLQPGESRVVADAEFVPPRGLRELHGGFCVRVYGWEMGSGIGTRYHGR